MKMKEIIYYYLLILILASFTSCKSNNQDNGVFRLLPIPNDIQIKGNSSLTFSDIKTYFSDQALDLPPLGEELHILKHEKEGQNADIIFRIDTALEVNSEGYNLSISNNQINIVGKDKAGLFYGFKTLEQLVKDSKDQNAYLPICNISDYPLLPYRAIHLDIKHHLDKIDYYYKLIDKLSGYKINAIIVEMEDKLKYERQPKVASPDAISIKDWKKLSDYAKERNIELSPLIQGLGHASFILKHENYKELRDDPKSDWAFNPLNPKTYEVLFDLYLDAIEATPHGKYLHIGGDEVHTSARGSSKSSLELQLIWLEKVSKFAEEHKRIPIFWDDMPLKHAKVYKPMFDTEIKKDVVDSIWAKNEHNLLKFLDKFPKNCIYMRWNYESSQTYGNMKAMEWFREHGLQVMGATAGQTRWVLMPQQESNIDNIKSFAVSSIKANLNGLLLTLWDDDSPHFELFNRGIISFAEYTWAGDKRSKKEIKTAYRHREFSFATSDSQYSFIDQLEEPVGFWKNILLKGNQRNWLQTKKNPIEESIIDFPNSNKGEWSKKYSDRLISVSNFLKSCDSVAKKISNIKSLTNHNNYTLDVYEQVNNLTSFTFKMLLKLENFDTAENEEQLKNSVDELEILSKEFKSVRNQLETVYGKTRILTKPKNYILDQDHHVHLGNQTRSFDWQFSAEILFLEKLDTKFLPSINLK